MKIIINSLNALLCISSLIFWTMIKIRFPNKGDNYNPSAVTQQPDQRGSPLDKIINLLLHNQSPQATPTFNTETLSVKTASYGTQTTCMLCSSLGEYWFHRLWFISNNSETFTSTSYYLYNCFCTTITIGTTVTITADHIFITIVMTTINVAVTTVAALLMLLLHIHTQGGRREAAGWWTQKW